MRQLESERFYSPNDWPLWACAACKLRIFFPAVRCFNCGSEELSIDPYPFDPYQGSKPFFCGNPVLERARRWRARKSYCTACGAQIKWPESWFKDLHAALSDSAPPCPFCPADRPSLAEGPHSIAFADAFPVARGHTLIVPRRHVASLFDLADEERADLFTTLARARELLRSQVHPDAFTIGVNDGPAAGQTVEHAHVHLIPRWRGDVADPRGGVRLLLPERARYWDA